MPSRVENGGTQSRTWIRREKVATKDKQDKQEGKSEKAGFASQVEALFLTICEGRFQMFGSWRKLGMRSVTSAKVRVPSTGSQYQSPYLVVLREAVQKVKLFQIAA